VTSKPYFSLFLASFRYTIKNIARSPPPLGFPRAKLPKKQSVGVYF